MTSLKYLLAAAIIAVPASANAVVVGSLGGGTGPFLTLSPAGLSNGMMSVATLVGGTVLNSDQPFADDPQGMLFGGTFLAAGPTPGQPATLTFTAPVTYLSFLWGSPDTYNTLTVNSTVGGAQTFDVASLNFAVRDGNQAFSQYVQFQTSGAADLITSVSFNNVPAINAFESANFSITAPIPEPATWALMISGFGLTGAAMRRRAVRTSVRFA